MYASVASISSTMPSVSTFDNMSSLRNETCVTFFSRASSVAMNSVSDSVSASARVSKYR
ncbi:hypothetical protein DPMN_064998 [Dreissena polymorpha]|uniref:Uncharacterized protein n=1 Tax=Dreissena polymorpha TaxID=45954 RepID=A0A9D4CE68_DREPO|nr:hypothetical protein DPMN_064998 [Dreissena polymorpha]